MNKKEKSMMNMVCLPMNKRVMRIWDLMETKEAFLILVDLVISGVGKQVTLKDLKVSLETLRICLVVKNLKNLIDLLEVKI